MYSHIVEWPPRGYNQPPGSISQNPFCPNKYLGTSLKGKINNHKRISFLYTVLFESQCFVDFLGDVFNMYGLGQQFTYVP